MQLSTYSLDVAVFNNQLIINTDNHLISYHSLKYLIIVLN